MNWETIIVALIAAIGPLIGTIISNNKQKDMLKLKLETLESQMEKLTEKVDRHNNFDRRLIVIETTLGINKSDKAEK